MDFRAFVGKRVIWVGEFKDSSGELKEKYVLFDDGTVGHFPDPESGTASSVLEAGLDVLRDHYKHHVDFAKNVIELGHTLERLKKPPVSADAPVDVPVEAQT